MLQPDGVTAGLLQQPCIRADGDERQAALLAPGEKLAAGRAYVRRVCGLRMLAVNAAVVAAAVISEATAEQKY
jgi:hypothetical protein